MANSRLEELLQELIDQNAVIINNLNDIVEGVSEIKDELNWIGEHSFAKRVVDNLDAIEIAINGLAD